MNPRKILELFRNAFKEKHGEVPFQCDECPMLLTLIEEMNSRITALEAKQEPS